MRKLVRALVLTVILLTVPAFAGAQTLQVSANDVLNAPEDFISDIKNMPSEQVGAIVGGGVIVGVLADTLLDGGIITVVGVVLGAAIGNYWYQHRYWPFG